MKIAILGAAWFVGRSLVSYFKWDHEIFAFTRSSHEKMEWVEYVFWENHNPTNFSKKIDICIDCVSDVDFTKSESELIDNNVTILKHTKEFLRQIQCLHYIYISSSSVYMGKDWFLSEEELIHFEDLRNSYARSKYLAEEYIRKNLIDERKITLLRPRAIYGEGDTTLIPKILWASFLSYLIFPWNKESFTSITNIENLLLAIKTVIEKQTDWYALYNVSDENPIRYNDLYTKITSKYRLPGIISLPSGIVKLLKSIFPNKWEYIEDTFSKNKRLDISKIKALWYNPTKDINSFLS